MSEIEKHGLPQAAFDSRVLSDEDKYFAEREQELLLNLRKTRDARQSVKRVCPCPECEGEALECVKNGDVEIDRCPKCQGIWLDAGELELLINRAKSAPKGLRRFFNHLAGNYDV